MFIDITLKITPEMAKDAGENQNKNLVGHLGTHFDLMNKEFPLEYLERKAIVFDVSGIIDRDIGEKDIDLGKVERNMFVAFFSGFIEKEGYGRKKYFSDHPQLSDKLIERLLQKEVSIIGVDFAGIRRGAEHTPKDQYCADRGAFVVENLCNLETILNGQSSMDFTANTYPLNYTGITGLPCRVVAKV